MTLVRPSGTGPMHCRDAIREACSVRVGKQGYTDAAQVVFQQAAFDTFRHGLVSAVTDGGPTEQKALYECSPGKLDYEGDAMFP